MIPYPELPERYKDFVRTTAEQLWALMEQNKNSKAKIKKLSELPEPVQKVMIDIVELIVNLYVDWAGRQGWDMKPIDLDTDMQKALEVLLIKNWEKMYCTAPSLLRLCGAEAGQYTDWMEAMTSLAKQQKEEEK